MHEKKYATLVDHEDRDLEYYKKLRREAWEKEKAEKEEKMVVGGAILTMVMSCIGLIALIYMMKSRRR